MQYWETLLNSNCGALFLLNYCFGFWLCNYFFNTSRLFITYLPTNQCSFYLPLYDLSYFDRSIDAKIWWTSIREILSKIHFWFFLVIFFLFRKITSVLAYREWYVSRTNQSVVFVLWFEGCSNFNDVMGDSERAVRKMESSIKMRSIAFSVFLTCILPPFMRNAILLDRWKISDYLR